VPAQSQIIEASEKTPLLSVFLRLDMPTVREVLSRDDIPEALPSTHRQGLVVGETTVGLLGASIFCFGRHGGQGKAAGDAQTALRHLLVSPSQVAFPAAGELRQRPCPHT
jgi:hypothetical protein